jgi:hypothetical protein
MKGRQPQYFREDRLHYGRLWSRRLAMFPELLSVEHDDALLIEGDRRPYRRDPVPANSAKEKGSTHGVPGRSEKKKGRRQACFNLETREADGVVPGIEAWTS